jgi:hypothetical protein
MTTQDASTSRGRKTWILGAGLVAIAAIVAYLGFDYPPASDDAAGTIVPANRYRADANSGAPTGDEADQVATSPGVASSGCRRRRNRPGLCLFRRICAVRLQRRTGDSASSKAADSRAPRRR